MKYFPDPSYIDVWASGYNIKLMTAVEIKYNKASGLNILAAADSAINSARYGYFLDKIYVLTKPAMKEMRTGRA